MPVLRHEVTVYRAVLVRQMYAMQAAIVPDELIYANEWIVEIQPKEAPKNK